METETIPNNVRHLNAAPQPTNTLDRFSTASLIQAVITLTHMIGDADRAGHPNKADAYRERREIAIREIERRARS